MKITGFTFLLSLFVFNLLGQNNNTKTINMYLRCSYCDGSYVRNELKNINHVRDLSDANVIVLGMSEEMGSGGEKYRLIFEGKNDFSGINDTIIFESNQDATTDEIRDLYIHHLKVGLLPYILKTPLGSKIEYSLPEIDTSKEMKPIDPWKGWVTTLNSNVSFNGEQSSRSLNIYSNIKIYKITDGWKLTFGAYNNYSKSNYSYDDYNYEYINKSYNSYIQYVLSLTEHWSFGFFTSAGSSTFSNLDFSDKFKVIRDIISKVIVSERSGAEV
ncbi:MAG: hypothetical protein GYA62_14235, partial [Bacteroidales bacterium]|nr:hypothetical protein [Bacteroidales bacterium]